MGERRRFILIREKSPDEVVELLRKCAAIMGKTLVEGRPRGRFEPALIVGGSPDCGAIFLPSWHKICGKLPQLVDGPWMTVRVQEGVLWNYTLCRGAGVIDEFSTRPFGWAEENPRDPKPGHKKGDPSVMAEAWGIPAAQIEKYLMNWKQAPDLDGKKAYPADRSVYGSAYQGNDFVVALGGIFNTATNRTFHVEPGVFGKQHVEPGMFPALSTKDFEETLRRWQEPHRRWHAWTHLVDLLSRIEAEADLSGPDAEMLRYVALFHDAVYDPLSATNEEDSARLAAQCLAHYDRLEEVTRAILATKHHQATDELTRKFNAWDCAILHETSWEELLAYEEGIAFEYKSVDSETYRRERSRFLRGAAKEYANPLLERLADEVASG